MKNSYLPHVTLAALLLAALLTMLAGGWMARDERVVRSEVGREEVGDFSAEMLGQLGRLDRLFEGHLRRLASMNLNERFALRKACEGVVGVRQIAVAVDVKNGAAGERAFQENFETGWRGVPMLPGQPEPALGGELFLLERDDMPRGAASGWVDRPGMPMMYWYRKSPGVYAVVTPDLEAVESAMHGWLQEWMMEVDEPLLAAGAEMELRGGRGVLLDLVVEEGQREARADVVVPLRSRFGAWKLAAWDKREIVIEYHVPTLVAAAAMACLFVMLGCVGFFALRRALRLGEQRVSFVNRVSHELRSPLTNILLNNDLAADAVELGDELAAAGRLGLVREEAGRLSRLIANVLTFSRSGDESVQVACEVFSMADLVERTLAPFRPSLGRKDIEVSVEIDDGLRALGDVDLAAQILANLVSNVEKYAAAGKKLGIVGGVVDSSVYLRVSDSGRGIPITARARIFEPFVRLSQRVDEGVSGTGLGLAIARELAAKMDGELVLVESEIGAVFELRLPVAPENVIALEEQVS